MKIIPILSTSLVPIVNVGMYYSNISPDVISEDFYNNENLDENITSDNEVFDMNKYCGYVKRVAQDFAEQEWLPIMKQFGVVSIKLTDWYHPHDYFYGSDRLDVELEVVDDFEEKITPILKDIIDNHSWAKEYINEHYKSHSGWISFMPKSYEQIITFKDIQCYGAALTLLMIDNGYDIESMQNWFEEKVLENCNYEDYCTWV